MQTGNVKCKNVNNSKMLSPSDLTTSALLSAKALLRTKEPPAKSRRTARQRQETPCCAMCLGSYAIPAPGEAIFSCTACSAVLHGECYRRFKESDRKRAQQRYGAQIEAHHVARPDSLCSPQVFPCTRCPECRRPNAVFARLPRKRAKPIRTQKQDLCAQLVMLRGRQDRILELRRLAQHGAMSKTRPIWPATARRKRLVGRG